MSIPENYKFSQELQLRWMDLDPLAHINNSIYIQYFELGRGKYMHVASPTWDWKEHMFLIANISCDYLRELTLSHHNVHVWVRTTRFGNKSFDLEYVITSENDGENIIHARGKSTQVMFDMLHRKSIPIPDWLKHELRHFEIDGTIAE